MNIQAVREDFPILKQTAYGRPLIYLDNAATTQIPLWVEERMRRYFHTGHANVHRGAHYLSELATEQMESARQTTADFLGASAEEIIFTSGATAGINMAARSFESLVSQGDRVLVSGMEHHSDFLPWQELCNRTGAEFCMIPVTPRGELDLNAYRQLLKGQTKLVAVVAVSNVLGTRNPLPVLAEAAHTVGAYVLADGAQALRHGRLNMGALGCDLFAFSGHKMMGPTGTGVLYMRRELMDVLRPGVFGGGMVEEAGERTSTYAPGPAGFEAGTPNIAGILGLATAMEYLEGLGLDDIAEREATLLAALEAGLRAMPGVELYGEPAERAGALSFNLTGVHPFDTAGLLDRLGIAVRAGHHCAQPLMRRLGVTGTVRVSPAFYNTETEVDAFLAGIEKVRKATEKCHV